MVHIRGLIEKMIERLQSPQRGVISEEMVWYRYLGQWIRVLSGYFIEVKVVWDWKYGVV